jgi:hypothetical protein
VEGEDLLRLGPPDDGVLDEVFALERDVASGALVRTRAPGAGEPNVRGPVRPAGIRPGAGRRVLRLALPEDLADLWISVERLYERRRIRGVGFARFLCLELWRAWGPGLGEPRVAYRNIYERDRFRCLSPVCSRRDVTPHHLTFRSHGGDDSEENLATACAWCHLQGIHDGRLAAKPPASSIRWRIGRKGLLRVDGRRLRPQPGTDGEAPAVDDGHG